MRQFEDWKKFARHLWKFKKVVYVCRTFVRALQDDYKRVVRSLRYMSEKVLSKSWEAHIEYSISN